MNPLYTELNKGNILSQFEAFKKSFNGNPKEEVQKLLDSGRLSQAEFNRLSQMATQLQKMLNV